MSLHDPSKVFSLCHTLLQFECLGPGRANFTVTCHSRFGLFYLKPLQLTDTKHTTNNNICVHKRASILMHEYLPTLDEHAAGPVVYSFDEPASLLILF